MRAHYFQHVPFEGIGHIKAWLTEHTFSITHTHFFDGEPLPAQDEVDLLIVMGGPMSVNDEAELPWLVAEKAFIRQAIDAGKPVLGICLGAQLIANALGAEVHRNRHTEIGWFPVRRVDTAQTEARSFGFPAEMTVFHWHGETFEIPAGGVRLAENDACRNQAFQYGDKVLGLQFHLEMTPALVQASVENGTDELIDGQPYIQPVTGILAASPSVYNASNALMGEVLDFLTAQQ